MIGREGGVRERSYERKKNTNKNSTNTHPVYRVVLEQLLVLEYRINVGVRLLYISGVSKYSRMYVENFYVVFSIFSKINKFID